MIRKIIALIILIGISIIGYIQIEQMIIRNLGNAYLQSLATLGAEQTTYSRKLTHKDVLHINGIKFDPDGFSALPKSLITYDYRNIFAPHKTDNISIQNPIFSGELDNEFDLTLAGINFQKPNEIQIQPNMLDLKNLKLEIFDQNLGGLLLQGDLSLKGNQLSGSINTVQRPLAFESFWEGTLTPEPDISITLQGLRFQNENIKTVRGHGDIALTGHYPEALQLSGNFQIGGLTLYGFGFGNAVLKMEKTADQFQLHGNAQASNFEEITITIKHQRKGGTQMSEYIITAPDSEALFAYLQNYSDNADYDAVLLGHENIRLIFGMKGDDKIYVTISADDEILLKSAFVKKGLSIQKILSAL